MINYSSKKRGFTLIEILAVIVIIGIIGIIGVASISSYVEDSRKTAFVSAAKNYLDEAKSLKSNDDLYYDPKNTEAVLIPLSEIKIEGDGYDTGYGEVDLNNSYVIIVNEKGKYHYYITLVDETGHAFIVENTNTISKDKIKADQRNSSDIVSIESLRYIDDEVEIEVGGIKYKSQVRNEEKETILEDGKLKITTSVILLDNSILGEFEVEYDTGWTNDDKVITVNTFNDDIEYKYYISNKSQKPLASDSNWQDENKFVKDLGTYYVFIKSDDNEVSDPEKVVIDKIDRVAPKCALEVTHEKPTGYFLAKSSSHGVFNSSVVVTFDSKVKDVTNPATKDYGATEETTSQEKHKGIVIKGEELESDDDTVSISASSTKKVTYVGYIVDYAGNQNTCEKTVIVDGNDPTVTFSLAEGVYKTAQTVVVTPDDGDGSVDYFDVVIEKLKTGSTYDVVGVHTKLTEPKYEVNLTADGYYRITVTVVDTAGNVYAESVEYGIDKTKPTCGFELDGIESMTGYYGTDVNIKLVTSDPNESGAVYNSGINQSGINSITGGNEIVLSTDSEGITYTGYVSDKAGNQNTCQVTVKRRANFTITYNNNSGSGCSTKPVVFNKEYGILCEPTRVGYTFGGWYSDSELTTKVTSTTKFMNETTTLYANWGVNSYKVTFNANGGSVTTASKNVVYDSTYGELPVPSRPGYIFSGWYTEKTNGTIVSSSTKVTITGNQTLYAHWTICAAGTYNDGTKSTCTKCSAGTYSAAGASSCSNCAAGTYSAEGASSCSNCAAGTYSASGASGCTTCPSGYPNSASKSTSINSCYMNVGAGKYLGTAKGTTLTSCASGKYKEAHIVYYGSTSTCDNCPSGYTSDAGATTQGSCYIKVAAGKYLGTAKSATLTNCAANTYKIAHTVYYGSTSKCDSCPSGYISDAGATAQSSCYIKVAAGKYLGTAKGTTLTNCAANTYKTAHTVNYGSTSTCVDCPSGYVSAAGATAQSSCYINVGAGKYLGTAKGTTLSSCAANTYSSAHTVNYGSTSNCTACPTGQVSAAGASTCYVPTTTISHSASCNTQTYTVEATGKYKLEVWGASGGGYTIDGSFRGGLGGYSVGIVSLTAGQKLYIVTGGIGSTNGTAGCNGGGAGMGSDGSGASDYYGTNGAGGGGATHIATASGLLSSLSSSNVLIVAGGGGGQGGVWHYCGDDSYGSYQCGYSIYTGGDGGGSPSGGAFPATSSTYGANSNIDSANGSFGQGGPGQNGVSYCIEATPEDQGGVCYNWAGWGFYYCYGDDRQCDYYTPGGGGGGYYGGAGGGKNGSSKELAGSGGSGYLSSSLTDASMTNGVNNGNGYAKITYVG